MVCKDLCRRYIAKHKKHGSYYDAGAKRCVACGKFLMWEGLWCPCCSGRLRTRPSRFNTKDLIRRVKNVHKIQAGLCTCKHCKDRRSRNLDPEQPVMAFRYNVDGSGIGEWLGVCNFRCGPYQTRNRLGRFVLQGGFKVL